MAVDRKSVIPAVYTLRTVDLKGIALAFPVEYTHDARKVTFDRYEAGTEIALKGSFSDAATVVEKDGYTTHTVNPMEINEKIVDEPFNAGKKRIGENEYGQGDGLDGATRAEIEYEMKSFGKLKKRGERRIKEAAYNVLVTGKVVVSKDGVETDEIDYGLTDKVVNSGTTGPRALWTATAAKPVDQLINESIAKGVYAYDTVIMGADAYAAWSANANVRTIDDTTTGKRANFRPATPEQAAAKGSDTLIFLGTTIGAKYIDVYVELDQYNDGATDQYFLEPKFAVCFKGGAEDNAQVQYGAIPVATGDGSNVDITLVEAKEFIDGEAQKDPAGIKRIYKTSPLPTMNKPKAFKSIQTVA
jgi:hypothetical protein